MPSGQGAALAGDETDPTAVMESKPVKAIARNFLVFRLIFIPSVSQECVAEGLGNLNRCEKLHYLSECAHTSY
jgi:hypothetical protein